MVSFNGQVFGSDMQSTIDRTWASTALVDRVAPSPIRKVKKWKEAVETILESFNEPAEDTVSTKMVCQRSFPSYTPVF
ncbi:hypothetical protein NUU61_001600 [Penicillium alfredii]|uniref:Uncharacterized protein n=1 Tax=Penicillium alfredii TaxID=1506179 RepID=A0A9W9G1P1_9EURO|nr:uncharacterized protein NUU61_001600 [Penicillium alfredii]KAJ5110343.1 hypothetical protein NUU61_001600 [Penicillium alfredii]